MNLKGKLGPIWLYGLLQIVDSLQHHSFIVFLANAGTMLYRVITFVDHLLLRG